MRLSVLSAVGVSLSVQATGRQTCELLRGICLSARQFAAVTAGGDESGRHPLPRTRSVDQAQMEGSSVPRSPDAPPDPFDKRHRDTSGMTEQEVREEVEAAVGRAGARATEALSGRADMLRANPSFHMNQSSTTTAAPDASTSGANTDPGSQPTSASATDTASAIGAELREKGHKFDEWAHDVVGDGVKESVKSGTSKATQALHRMFGNAKEAASGAARVVSDSATTGERTEGVPVGGSREAESLRSR